MFLCALSIFVGYGDRIVNLTMGWFAIKLYQAEVPKRNIQQQDAKCDVGDP